MLKKKYLHTNDYKGSKSKFKRNKNIDLFSDLPKHERIRTEKFYYWWAYSSINFEPLIKFIKSKIGENWNDIYSEILLKIKPKFRYTINNMLFGNQMWWICVNPIYDENYLPRDFRGKLLKDRLYVDYNNILCFKSKEQLLLESKKIIRLKKMKQILNNEESQD